jgi:pimeloyl-ACP methyl ester carboxylesterase
MFRKLLVLVLCCLVVSQVTVAQDATPQAAEVKAADGLALKGDYYAAPGEGAHPAVLLLHMLNGSRAQWKPLIGPLLDAGYSVLAVDLRGHGQTGDTINWTKATTDVQTWLDWLRQQPGVDGKAVSIVGASIGSNLALVGCANDKDCVTAVALSPGLDYFGLKTSKSITEGLSRKSALLVASQNDKYSSDSVKTLIGVATGDISARIYKGGAHGTQMLAGKKGAIPVILAWLEEHAPVQE